MKIYMVNGSIKKEKSSSEYLLNHIEEKLIDSHNVTRLNYDELKDAMSPACEIIIFAFPLYIDSIPSDMLALLEQFECEIAKNNPEAKIYAVINNAFYEPENDIYGVQIIKHWCRHAGLEFGGALCVGAGPIIGISPLGTGPMKNLDEGLNKFAKAVDSKTTLSDFILVEPNISKTEYLENANSNWTKAAARRGLTEEDLKATP